MSETQLSDLANSGYIPTVYIHPHYPKDDQDNHFEICIATCCRLEPLDTAKAITDGTASSDTARPKTSSNAAYDVMKNYGEKLTMRIQTDIADTPAATTDPDTLWGVMYHANKKVWEEFVNPGYHGEILLRSVVIDNTSWNTRFSQVEGMEGQYIDGYDVYRINTSSGVDLRTGYCPPKIERGTISEVE